MSRLHLRRPSPGLILASVALFVALGGGAYAATSSDTKSDKKIAKKAAKSYFNGHIGGASVSHANTANSATNATNATTAANANALGGTPASTFGPAAAIKRYDITMNPGDADVTVDQNGALSIVAHCDTTGPEADLFVRTTLDHSSMDVSDQNNDFGPADTTVNWGTPESAPGPSFEANREGLAVAPDGSVIIALDAATGYNIGSAPNKCFFAGADMHG